MKGKYKNNRIIKGIILFKILNKTTFSICLAKIFLRIA